MGLDLSKTATNLLKKLGSNNFGISKIADRPIDPDTGLPSGPKPEPVITNYFGALISYGSPVNANTNILSGDKRLLLEHAAPYVWGDVIVIYGENWAVVNADEINPSGIRQIWDLHVRKS